MLGRRRLNTRFGTFPDDMQPGDFWKYLDRFTGEVMYVDFITNLTHTAWGFYSPDGNGIGALRHHTVRENENNTVSVLPGDGSSNSILHSGGAQHKTWHGFIYNDDWRKV